MKKLRTCLHEMFYALIIPFSFVFSAILALGSYWFLVVYIYVPYNVGPFVIEGYILWAVYEFTFITMLFGRDFWDGF